MSLKMPFNLHKWIEENRDLLKPPVGNKNLYVESDDYIIMIVAGPNARKDYHYNYRWQRSSRGHLCNAYRRS